MPDERQPAVPEFSAHVDCVEHRDAWLGVLVTPDRHDERSWLAIDGEGLGVRVDMPPAAMRALADALTRVADLVTESADDELDGATRWAEGYLDERARLEERLSGDELREHDVQQAAEVWILADGWVIAHPDDPAMRRHLIGQEGYPPRFADAVLIRMRELAAERDVAEPGWDEHE